jgi:TonB-dependent receptor
MLAALLVWTPTVWAQQVGSIRGMVSDEQFKLPVAGAKVLILETGAKTVTAEAGNFVFTQVAPGKHTLVISKEGFMRQMKSIVVSPDEMAEVEIPLVGEFVEMEPYVVEDIDLGSTGTEAALIKVRAETVPEMDFVTAQNMKLAAVSSAADALPLITGVTTEGGKYAVVRGLPDRYVVSLMNGVRLPTADENKRAVQLDQFPAAVIDSIRVTKTATPDQQGDASGGAVDLVLKGVPDETLLSFTMKKSWSQEGPGRNGFLTYKGGGVNVLGIDDGRRKLAPVNGAVHPSVVGVSWADASQDYDWSFSFGGKRQVTDSVKVGGFTNFYYKRTSDFHDDGVDDQWWVRYPGQGLMPKTAPFEIAQGDYTTSLYNVTQGSQGVQWGALGVIGAETRAHAITLTYMYTHTAQDTATLAEDTRGKHWFYPKFNPNDPNSDGYWDFMAAPYQRIETLDYMERTTTTLQLRGRHILPLDDWGPEFFRFKAPILDWTVAHSTSEQDEPDKRMFASYWLQDPDPTYIGVYGGLKPVANYTIGNFQNIWRTIYEQSNQYSINYKMPFTQWTHDEGYLKFGVFHDKVARTFTQESYSNLSDNVSYGLGAWTDNWAQYWPRQTHAPIVDAQISVPYDGMQDIGAVYWMADVPLTNFFNVIGGVRYETTQLQATLHPQPLAGRQTPVGLGNANFNEKDVLPSLGFQLKILDDLTLKGSYAETVARQTFKELTPIMYQEYMGGPVFIGNPDLRMSHVKNYDLRTDWTPYHGSLFSASYFVKDIRDPIEQVQAIGNVGLPFIYTTARNYPKGTLSGIELEARQKMEDIWEPLKGLTLGANATFIDSNVILPKAEAAAFNSPGIKAPMTSRDMTNAPCHLYNLSVIYDLGEALSESKLESVRKFGQDYGTQFALFYTVRGDTLVAGAGHSTVGYIPNVYAKQFDTLNASITQKVGKNLRLFFQAKNLTNPKIEEVYRSKYSGPDKVKASYTKGIDLSVGFTVEFSF